MGQREYLVEFQRYGGIVKVTAIDTVTGREAVIQGPASAGEHALKLAAVKKLEFLLLKGNTREGSKE